MKRCRFAGFSPHFSSLGVKSCIYAGFSSSASIAQTSPPKAMLREGLFIYFFMPSVKISAAPSLTLTLRLSPEARSSPFTSMMLLR